MAQQSKQSEKRSVVFVLQKIFIFHPQENGKSPTPFSFVSPPKLLISNFFLENKHSKTNVILQACLQSYLKPVILTKILPNRLFLISYTVDLPSTCS